MMPKLDTVNPFRLSLEEIQVLSGILLLDKQLAFGPMPHPLHTAPENGPNTVAKFAGWRILWSKRHKGLTFRPGDLVCLIVTYSNKSF